MISAEALLARLTAKTSNFDGVPGSSYKPLVWSDVAFAFAGLKRKEGRLLELLFSVKYIGNDSDYKELLLMVIKRAQIIASKEEVKLPEPKRKSGYLTTKKNKKVILLADLALDEIIKPNVCNVCNGIGNVVITEEGKDPSRYECEKCRGAKTNSRSARSRARYIGLHHSTFKQNGWEKLYKIIYRDLIDSESRGLSLIVTRMR